MKGRIDTITTDLGNRYDIYKYINGTYQVLLNGIGAYNCKTEAELDKWLEKVVYPENRKKHND